MRIVFLSSILLGIFVTGQAQSVDLNLHHEFNGSAFTYNTTYNFEGSAVSISRVQYYLSGFSITHDGGQITTPGDSYILASGNVTSYQIDTVNCSIIEGVDFSVGVDYDANHGNVTNWPSTHPLSSQLPTMDWGWPSGYFFIIINGKIDNTGDGNPNKAFELHGLGDALLRPVNFSGLSISGSTIDMYVNIADWIKNLNLEAAGSQHNGGPYNTTVADNTNDETVFTLTPSVGLEEWDSHENHITVDYTLPYAPSINYSISTSDDLRATVHDLNGKLIYSKDGLHKEGSFFILKEMKDGIYVVNLSNHEVKETLKIFVRN